MIRTITGWNPTNGSHIQKIHPMNVPAQLCLSAVDRL
jgi:hypothetical protein